MMNSNVLDTFVKYFNIIPADGDYLIDETLKLRYQVFCEEFEFEDKNNFPDNKEFDQYDSSALHYLILHKSTNKVIASIRLLLAESYPKLLLPYKNYCESPASNLKQGELSRLVVAKEFRRRQSDGVHPLGVNSYNVVPHPVSIIQARNFPLVAVGIMLCGIATSCIAKRDLVFAMMEPKLQKVLAKYGIHFDQVGEVTKYHGLRAAYVINPNQVWETVHPELEKLFYYIYKKLDPKYSSKIAG